MGNSFVGFEVHRVMHSVVLVCAMSTTSVLSISSFVIVQLLRKIGDAFFLSNKIFAPLLNRDQLFGTSPLTFLLPHRPLCGFLLAAQLFY